jgi:shikimate dehydrogenase
MPEAPTFLSTITGSFSTPAGDNPTVAMIEAAYRHHGIDARYLNCEVAADQLGHAVRGAVAMGWAGFNCSIPHKVAVLAHLDRLAESAEIIGAVNCVVRRGDELVGENTDGQGFLTSLRTVVDPAGRSFAAHLTVINRDPERGQELVSLIRSRTPAEADLLVWDQPIRLPADVSVVVNGTSIGLSDPEARLNVDPRSLPAEAVVADVIPNPPRTALIRDAAERGCVVLDGLGMLVEQGVISIRHWAGVDADSAVMRRALQDALGLDPTAT